VMWDPFQKLWPWLRLWSWLNVSAGVFGICAVSYACGLPPAVKPAPHVQIPTGLLGAGLALPFLVVLVGYTPLVTVTLMPGSPCIGRPLSPGPTWQLILPFVPLQVWKEFRCAGHTTQQSDCISLPNLQHTTARSNDLRKAD
jgi:hypothetical protein